MKAASAPSGFTLIEVLVSIALLAVIAVSVSALLLSNLRSDARIRNEQQVAVAARKYMEETREKWAGPAPSSAYNAASLPALPGTSELPKGVTCTASVTPNTVWTPSPTFRSRQVTLTCSGGTINQAFSLEIAEPWEPEP